MARRPDGALEADVLRALWELGVPVTPGEVLDHLGTDLAYTSIATVLSRLCDKGLAGREKRGRSYRYHAAASEADLAARRIRSIIESVGDRDLALAGFARSLDPDDAARLARFLDER